MKTIKADKLIKKGLKTTVGMLSIPMYSKKKSASKSKADITFIGKQQLEKVGVQLFEYTENTLNEHNEVNDFQVFSQLDPKQVNWINFHGIHEVKLFEEMAKIMEIERLTIRHIVDTTQRPKLEEYDHYLFFTIKSILERVEDEVEIEQLSFILGKEYLISFQEKVGDHFEHIRGRIRDNLGLVRKKNEDFLLYLLLDAILDNYFETIDELQKDIVEMEAKSLKSPSQDMLVRIESKKKVTGIIKKSLLPMKEALTKILNDKLSFIYKENLKYYRDLRNNCLNAIEEIDSVSQSLDSLTNVYFSSLSHKMNEIMKVLTLVATIFIPLTFIVGVYGMNFEYMPELGYKYGYFVVWGVMLTVGILMAIYFKRKKWL